MPVEAWQAQVDAFDVGGAGRATCRGRCAVLLHHHRHTLATIACPTWPMTRSSVVCPAVCLVVIGGRPRGRARRGVDSACWSTSPAARHLWISWRWSGSIGAGASPNPGHRGAARNPARGGGLPGSMGGGDPRMVDRWGQKVWGWWFDGCYFADAMYRHPDAPNFASFAAAAKAGNPDA